MSTGIQFDPAAIRELAKILRETDLSEIELVEGDRRVRVGRSVTVAPTTVTVAAPTMATPAPAPAVVAEPVADATHPGAVTSPMVGIAYLAPEPGAPPFVTVGSRVAQGQTLLLIEAMKTFNQIRAPRAGTVTRILVEGGAPVEYGEALLIVE